MLDHFAIEPVAADPAATREIEFVERKGIGHPDSLCDGIAEAVSRQLSRFYREEVGHILHHNTDKVHLGAGRAEPAFSGGTVHEPIYVLIGGRATKSFGGTELPVDEIAAEAAREYLLATVPQLEPDHFEIETRIGRPSADLASLFSRSDVPLANDTSFGVGYAPGSPVEHLVRTLEPRLHREIEAVGKDVKLMGLRRGDQIHLTIAAAILDRHVADIDDYLDATARVEALAERHARETTTHPVSVQVNTADDVSAGDLYLTTTGLSAEMGDDGAVGRGNRANGLITPHRPMSLEATSGKNPVTHVGKLYNLLAIRIAERLHEDAGAEYSSVQLLSRIGDPITEPWAVDVTTTATDRDSVRTVATEELAEITALTDELVRGEVDTF